MQIGYSSVSVLALGEFSLRRRIIRISVNYPMLSEQTFAQEPSQKSTFWNDATKYASASKDEPFVEEVAYMMVTLHRTGA
ncbi:hypothetical protein AAA799P11_00305 [Marine Group I thaumarchaeote SCGC AAA799-P11]|uniref:Uncharacterized protein n=1 Tax=Marine Group I thaumarchaeote SCGC AAA799-P11 TaxID=1502295 RepID=A0A087S2P7_9ARCH|nr:hypothetical protein AAA799P11_00305 [Marine Group I thaumarchaeote SCGC AAA799-P11]